jgi:hypothetical protein
MTKKSNETTHPLVEIISEEIPVLEVIVQFEFDGLRVTVQALSSSCSTYCQSHNDKTHRTFLLQTSVLESKAVRRGLNNARVASERCMTAFERRRFDKNTATLASPHVQSCSLSFSQSELVSSPAVRTSEPFDAEPVQQHAVQQHNYNSTYLMMLTDSRTRKPPWRMLKTRLCGPESLAAARHRWS